MHADAISTLLSELLDTVARNAQPHRFETAIPELLLMRADRPTAPLPALYEPMLCLVAQGAKAVLWGTQRCRYDTRHSLLASLAVPVSGAVLQASRAKPYLALAVRLDRAALAELVLALPPAPPAPEPAALHVAPVQPAVLDAALRLARLVESPADIPVLAPLLLRELHYRLLTGPHGAHLRAILQVEGPDAQLARAVARLRQHFAEPLAIAALADRAGMSTATFHRRFRALAGCSPLQYQKQVRLQEARRLLLAGGTDAAGAGFAVGYESPSQFSREYARLFGQPPARDAAALRAGPLPLAA